MPPTGEERKQAKQPTRVDNTTNPDRDQGSVDDGIPVRRRRQPRHDNTPLTPRTHHADIATAARPTSRRRPSTPRARHADITTTLAGHHADARRHHDSSPRTPRQHTTHHATPTHRHTTRNTPRQHQDHTTTTSGEAATAPTTRPHAKPTQRPHNDPTTTSGAPQARSLKRRRRPNGTCVGAGLPAATANREPAIAVRLPEQRPRAAPSPGVPLVTPERPVRIQVPETVDGRYPTTAGRTRSAEPGQYQKKGGALRG